MPKTGSKQQLGVRGEDLTCAELERQGMQVLERNWRCRLGEPLQSLARDDTSDLPDQF